MLERNILDDNLTLSAYVCASGWKVANRRSAPCWFRLNPLANEIADAASIPARRCRA